MKVLGIVIIVLGALGLAYGGFRYAWPDNVANVGPVHVTVEKHRNVLIPPVLGLVAVAAGAALLVAGPRSG